MIHILDASTLCRVLFCRHSLTHSTMMTDFQFFLFCTHQDKYDDLGGLIDTAQDVRATLLDTRGPEIRCGKLAHDDSGHETISLVKGESITLQTKSEYSEAGTTTDLFINYDKLHECLHPGMKVLLDDGAVILTVTDINSSGGSVVCSIDNSGELRSRAGVNLPMAETELPAMSEKDKKDIKYGLEIDVDYVAASFIQTPEAVREIRDYMKETAKELGWEADRPLPLIISKIESASALKHFDEILEESDGIMVARGDLGVEIPIQVRPCFCTFWMVIGNIFHLLPRAEWCFFFQHFA